MTRPPTRAPHLAAERPCLPQIRLVGLCLVAGATLLSCGSTPTSPRYAPDQPPFLPYRDLVLLPGGTTLGLTHVPLLSTSYDPRTGFVQVITVDSLAGLWTLALGTATLQRVSPSAVHMPAVSPDGTQLAFEVSSAAGLTVFRAPLTPTGPDLSAATPLLIGLSTPRWADAGDSLVLQHTLDPATYIVSSNDGNGHPLLVSTTSSEPIRGTRALYYTTDETAASPLSSKLAIYSRSDGSDRLRLQSLTVAYSHPRLSPDGTHIAFFTRPIRGGNWSLWTADTTLASATLATPHAVALGEVVWSLDGTLLIYVRYAVDDYTTDNGSVWMKNLVSGELRLLASNP